MSRARPNPKIKQPNVEPVAKRRERIIAAPNLSSLNTSMNSSRPTHSDAFQYDLQPVSSPMENIENWNREKKPCPNNAGTSIKAIKSKNGVNTVHLNCFIPLAREAARPLSGIFLSNVFSAVVISRPQSRFNARCVLRVIKNLNLAYF